MKSTALSVPTDFLSSSPDPWVRYRLRTWLEGAAGARERREVLAHPRMKALVKECARWPGDSRADHRAARDTLNKLTVLTDFGLRRGDAGMDVLAERILAHRDEAGRIRNAVLMPRRESTEWLFDIDGQDPLLALCASGFADDPRVRGAVRLLRRSAAPEGGWTWPDAPSPLPCRKFVGGCPYPTLKILRLLALDGPPGTVEAERAGTELLLDLADREERRYGFGFGEAFQRLRYPFVWFDVLHVLEALSPYPWVWADRRFLELLKRVTDKADARGRFTPEAVFLEWKDLCFGQKREPSPWLTLVVHRILARAPNRNIARTSARRTSSRRPRSTKPSPSARRKS
jgi:hypothetical protein